MNQIYYYIWDLYTSKFSYSLELIFAGEAVRIYEPVRFFHIR